MSPMSVTPGGRCRLVACGLNLRASCCVTGDLPRQAIVAELVAAGYGVESVDGHRQLEEVFMSIVGTPTERFEDSDEAAQ